MPIQKTEGISGNSKAKVPTVSLGHENSQVAGTNSWDAGDLDLERCAIESGAITEDGGRKWLVKKGGTVREQRTERILSLLPSLYHGLSLAAGTWHPLSRSLSRDPPRLVSRVDRAHEGGKSILAGVLS